MLFFAVCAAQRQDQLDRSNNRVESLAEELADIGYRNEHLKRQLEASQELAASMAGFERVSIPLPLLGEQNFAPCACDSACLNGARYVATC